MRLEGPSDGSPRRPCVANRGLRSRARVPPTKLRRGGAAEPTEDEEEQKMDEEEEDGEDMPFWWSDGGEWPGGTVCDTSLASVTNR